MLSIGEEGVENDSKAIPKPAEMEVLFLVSTSRLDLNSNTLIKVSTDKHKYRLITSPGHVRLKLGIMSGKTKKTKQIDNKEYTTE